MKCHFFKQEQVCCDCEWLDDDTSESDETHSKGAGDIYGTVRMNHSAPIMQLGRNVSALNSMSFSFAETHQEI